MKRALLLLAACGGPAAAPARPAPTPATPTPPQPPSNTAPAPPPEPACVHPYYPVSEARLTDTTVVACYLDAQPGGDADDCWSFDLAASTWRFTTRKPHADLAIKQVVAASATAAVVCKADGSDCKTIPLAGIAVHPDDVISAATNADRSIVAVWTGTGPIHVFDGAGKRLATIKPWPTGMMGNDPSFFRAAHVLGSVVEVRIADTPMTSAIRLYDARTGKKIADVFKGGTMDDTVPPAELGGGRYGFVTFDPKVLLVVDVATGKQVGKVAFGGDAEVPSLLAGTADGNALAVVGGTVLRFDLAAGTVARFAAPACTQ